MLSFELSFDLFALSSASCLSKCAIYAGTAIREEHDMCLCYKGYKITVFFKGGGMLIAVVCSMFSFTDLLSTET